jgi:hemerythrin superfamily protein
VDAIEVLTDQHREIDSLFDQIDTAARARTKIRLRRKLVDLLAVHMAVEERILFPAARDAGLEALLASALVEHLSAESVAAELVQVPVGSDALAARLAVLRDRKRAHAAAEEEELFPAVRRRLAPHRLVVLGERMALLADQLLGPGVGARERVTARRALA